MAFAPHPVALLGIGLLAGCGLTPARFDAEFSDAYCALIFSCEDTGELAAYGWADEAECADELSHADSAAPDDYDKDAAQACLDALRALSCEDLASGPLPGACSEAE